MKKYITIALLCLLNIAFSQDSAELNEKEMNTEIAFGRFTDCLRGGSICVFRPSVEQSNSNATIFLEKNNRLTIKIEKNKISKTSEFNLFRNEVSTLKNLDNQAFLMEEDLYLEEEVIRAIDPRATFTKIVKGNYPITISENYYTITLKLE